MSIIPKTFGLRAIAKLTLLPAATFFLLVPSALADTLTTPSFSINIQSNCPEGSVTCNNVSYTGTNRRTGASIRLRGSTLNRLCADGVTPCQFLGYQFRNGQYRYLVTDDGTLQVYQGEQLLLEEQGTWDFN